MTIIPRDPALIAVAKNGEFIGYADQRQIDREGLELYTGEAPKEAKVEEPKLPEPTEGEPGASPAAVRKGPPKAKPEA